ncbi:hypothetical protein BJ165DRAFT_1535836 [Panaeolus papilionaceus]|nr:hypothetical protein BJ165DRAFT_1535836 [Panaeolus papilionaceus]
MSLLVNHNRARSHLPPAEILNIIIAILQQECRPEELRSCCAKMGLIWKDYLPYMRSLLFHEGTDNRVLLPRLDGRRMSLAQLILEQPLLASYMRHITYFNVEHLLDEAIGRRTCPDIDILLRLLGVRSITITGSLQYSVPSYQDADPLVFGFRHSMWTRESQIITATEDLKNILGHTMALQSVELKLCGETVRVIQALELRPALRSCRNLKVVLCRPGGIRHLTSFLQSISSLLSNLPLEA